MLETLGLSFADAIILLGVLALVIREIFDLLGFSRSSKLLRQENGDLIRRIGELEASEIRDREEIRMLRQRVADLETSLHTLYILRTEGT